MLFRAGLLFENFNTLFFSTCSQCSALLIVSSVSADKKKEKKLKNPEIPGGIQMERFIPVEVFLQKSNTFRGITCFPFLPKRPRFSVPFVWITSARLHLQRKQKLVFYKWHCHNSIPFLFSVPKKISVPFDWSFHRNFLTNSKRSGKMVSVLKCVKVLILF